MVVQVPQGPSSLEEDGFEDSFDHFIEPGPLWNLDDVWGIWTGSEQVHGVSIKLSIKLKTEIVKQSIDQ